MKRGDIKKAKKHLGRGAVSSAPCPVNYGQGVRMTRAGFIRVCLGKRADKLKGWNAGGKAYDPLYPQCVGCETGALIAAGEDFPRPASVEWIEISDCGLRNAECGLKTVGAGLAREPKLKETIEMNETTWKKEWDIILRPVPAAELEKITKGLLQKYWHVAMAQKGEIATCVNCARIVKIRPCGLCGSCEAAGSNKNGPALLDALLECRARLQTPESQRQAAWIKKGKAAHTKEETEEVSNEIILITPLADIGSRYIRLGMLMQNTDTRLGDLASAAHELGLRLSLNIEVMR